jgi:hypothetical protein
MVIKYFYPTDPSVSISTEVGIKDLSYRGYFGLGDGMDV